MSRDLRSLVDELNELFDADPQGERAAALLADYARTGDDWRRYAYWDEAGYTRNLVESNERYELIVLCWSPGQRSPIHDHEGQNCWMSILDGRMLEQRYEFPDAGAPPPPSTELRFDRGEVAFIRDEIALHDVRPAPAARSATLHLYAAPIPSCRTFCHETGAVSRKHLEFYSVHGERVSS